MLSTDDFTGASWAMSQLPRAVQQGLHCGALSRSCHSRGGGGGVLVPS